MVREKGVGKGGQKVDTESFEVDDHWEPLTLTRTVVTLSSYNRATNDLNRVQECVILLPRKDSTNLNVRSMDIDNEGQIHIWE